MNLRLAGRAVQILSGILILLWAFHSLTSRIQPLISLIFYAALFFLGHVLVKRSSSAAQAAAPSLPSGFNAAYHHENIAIDTTAGKIWLRDGARSRVFAKNEILGWQVIYDNAQGLPTMVHGGVVTQGTKVKMNIRLGVQTTDLDHPEYFVRFKIKSIFQNTDRLYADAVSWGNRLNAFLRS